MPNERPQVERRSGEDRRGGDERRDSKRTVGRTVGRNDRRTGSERRKQERRGGVGGRDLPAREKSR